MCNASAAWRVSSAGDFVHSNLYIGFVAGRYNMLQTQQVSFVVE